MAYNFILIFSVLVVTLIIAVIIVRLMRPGMKEDSSLRSWGEDIDEKRQYPRVDVHWPVVVETPNGTENAVMRNIGIGGAFVVCEHPLPLNEIAQLTIETPLQKSLILNGKALWTNIGVRDDKIVNKGMRIQFVHNSDEDLQLLHHVLIATSQQQSSDDEMPSKTGDYENRRDSRVDVSWPVEMETSRGHIRAETRHVSISGAFIVCQDPLPLNERFHITMVISKQKQVSVHAEVIWSNINVPDDKIVNRGMGIRFINTSKDDLRPLAVELIQIVTGSLNPKD